jgi:hypothetical protein
MDLFIVFGNESRSGNAEGASFNQTLLSQARMPAPSIQSVGVDGDTT